MTISSQPREEASYSRLKALTHYHAPAGREALLAARHREKRAQVRSDACTGPPSVATIPQWSGLCWETFHLCRLCHTHLISCHCSLPTSPDQHHKVWSGSYPHVEVLPQAHPGTTKSGAVPSMWGDHRCERRSLRNPSSSFVCSLHLCLSHPAAAHTGFTKLKLEISI